MFPAGSCAAQDRPFLCRLLAAQRRALSQPRMNLAFWKPRCAGAEFDRLRKSMKALLVVKITAAGDDAVLDQIGKPVTAFAKIVRHALAWNRPRVR